jgi:prophage maintenance system killer protein
MGNPKVKRLPSKGLQLLDDYDHERLDIKGLSLVPGIHPHISEYESIVNAMRTEFDSSVFGKKKDAGFESAISQIEQGFDDSYVYQSIEERAAMLLYLIIKNHAFVDGNKRIGAACFLLFLMRNNLLLSANGVPFISNDALHGLRNLKQRFTHPLYGLFMNTLEFYEEQGGDVLVLFDSILHQTRIVESRRIEIQSLTKRYFFQWIFLWILNLFILLMSKVVLMDLFDVMKMFLNETKMDRLAKTCTSLKFCLHKVIDCLS